MVKCDEMSRPGLNFRTWLRKVASLLGLWFIYGEVSVVIVDIIHYHCVSSKSPGCLVFQCSWWWLRHAGFAQRFGPHHHHPGRGEHFDRPGGWLCRHFAGPPWGTRTILWGNGRDHHHYCSRSGTLHQLLGFGWFGLITWWDQSSYTLGIRTTMIIKHEWLRNSRSKGMCQ